MDVPGDWWQQACEVVNHPMACVGPDNRFVWVNRSFEQLVGYSRSELREKTWLEITVQEDVGGDLASANAIISGTDTQYTLSKRYKHKFGRLIPIELTVWRFPQDTDAPMLCFIVEAVPQSATTEELQTVREELEKGIANLEIRWQLLEEKRRTGVNIKMAGNDNSQYADRGGSNTHNTTTVVVAVVVALAIAFVSMAALVLSGNLEIRGNGGSVVIEQADEE